MLKFLLEIVIVCAFGVVVYLFTRMLPRIDDAHIASKEEKMKGDALSVYLEKIDEWLTIMFEKFLRRVKVWILRLDNLVNEQLNKFKKEPQKKRQFTEENEHGKDEDEKDGEGKDSDED